MSAVTAEASAGLSHFASAGRSGSKMRKAKPVSTEGSPSSRNNHCQPRSESSPSANCRMAPDSGAPMTLDTPTAVMNRAMTPARRLVGNQ